MLTLAPRSPAALDFVQRTMALGPDAAFPFQCSSGCSSGLPSCPPPLSPAARINASFSCMGVPEDHIRCLLYSVGPASVRVDADPWVAYVGT